MALSRLHFQSRREAETESSLVLLDTSGSLIARGAMASAKGVVAVMCQQAYVRRQALELLAFGGNKVLTVQASRKPPRDIIPLLDSLESGGGTPLRKALIQAISRHRQLARQRPQQRCRVYIVTDARSRDDLRGLGFDADVTVIDTEQSAVRLGRARALAAMLNARYRHIDSLPLR